MPKKGRNRDLAKGKVRKKVKSWKTNKEPKTKKVKNKL
jgi:hypothetical protein